MITIENWMSIFYEALLTEIYSGSKKYFLEYGNGYKTNGCCCPVYLGKSLDQEVLLDRLHFAAGEVFKNICASESDIKKWKGKCRFKGFCAGLKLGENPSSFGTILFPVIMHEGGYMLFEMDVRISFYEHSQIITDSYYGTPITCEPGFVAIVSLYNTPNDQK